MTIKSPKIFKMPSFDNINLNKMFLFMLVFATILLTTLSMILPLETIAKLNFFSFLFLCATGYFFIVDYDKLGLTHKNHIIIIISLFFMLIITSLNIHSSHKTMFVDMIKKEHPQLSTDFSNCSGKKNIILEDYKLIRENSRYYIVNDGIKYNLDDVAKYEYEEF